MDLSDYLDAGKCNWTVSISPKASVRFDQALWGVCCTRSPRHIVGEEMTEGVDETCQQRLMEPPISASSEICVFPMDPGVLIVVVQTINFPSTSSCRLEGEQCQLAGVFSQPFPFSLSLCITTCRISLWLPAKAIRIQDFQFFTRNTGTYLIQHQIGWATLAFPRTSKGTGSDCSAVCYFLILSSGLRYYVLILL